MKESSWKECIETNSSLSVSSNPSKIKSLIETAGQRIDYLKEQEIKDKNARFIFEGYYTSATEILHALVLKEGFKVSNHLCLGLFIKDVLKKPELFRIFDDCRYKRNSIVYYGKKLDIDIAEKTIKDIMKIIKEIKLLMRW